MRVDDIEPGVTAGVGRMRGNEGSRTSVTRRARASSLVTVVAVALLIGAGVWAWRANVSGKPAMDMNMRISSGAAAFPVTLAPVERGPVSGSVTYTGTVTPYVEEDVFPRVMGRIVEMPVYPGDAVKPGQIVARLDGVELGSKVQEAAAGAAAASANVAQMEADVTAARHGVAQMEREIRMAEADVVAARDGVTQMERELVMVEADAEHQGHLIVRDERLYKSGAVSLEEVEASRAMVTGARAKVAAAKAKISQMRAMVTAAEAKLDAARSRLERERAMEASALRKRDAMVAMATQSRAMQRTMEVMRDYSDIRASSPGYVVKRMVSPGVVVEPGMAILKIAQIDRVRLQANVGEKDLASIKVGSAVRVTTTAREGTPLVARVTAVFPFVDMGGRTGVVEALVENKARRYLPGQYVTMEFVTGEQPDALSVPRTALARMGSMARVWVVADGRAEPREVKTGLEGADRVEIRSGLTGDERVVARGHEGLYARARVAEVGSTTPPSPGADHSSHGSAPPPPKPEAPARSKEGGHAGH
jgi:RND family efflux transporter MFP subunit